MPHLSAHSHCPRDEPRRRSCDITHIGEAGYNDNSVYKHLNTIPIDPSTYRTYTLPGMSFVTETCRLYPFEMYLAHNLIKCYKTVNDSKTEDFYVYFQQNCLPAKLAYFS